MTIPPRSREGQHRIENVLSQHCSVSIFVGKNDAQAMSKPTAKPYWVPNDSVLQTCQLTAFRKHVLSLHRHVNLPPYDYQALHRWSVEAPAQFWSSLWSFLRILSHAPYKSVISTDDEALANGMPKLVALRWFAGAKLNFAEHVLLGSLQGSCQGKDGWKRVAVVAERENGTGRQVTFLELYEMVAKVSTSFRKLGVQVGDVVAGVVTNSLETLVLLLATTACGAVWTSVAPEFGVDAIISRWSQVEPKLLIGVASYRYKGKWIQTLQKIQEVAEKLTSVKTTILVEGKERWEKGQSSESVSNKQRREREGIYISYASILEQYSNVREATFTYVDFDQSVCILFSSGTTGSPKCIVQSFGVLLNHLKEHSLHLDMSHNSVLLFYTSTSWMMFNWIVSALALGTTLVLYDGHPFPPGDPLRLLKIASTWKVTHLGVSPKYLKALEKAIKSIGPIQNVFDSQNLISVMVTGSPSSRQTFEFVSSWSKKSKIINYVSISGGTDINGCFLLGCPWRCTYIPELTVAALGANVQVWSETGIPIGDYSQGELVCLSALPSMPRLFYGDSHHKRYRDSYFDKFGEQVWYHGDFAQMTENGGYVIAGRSDATLNPGGQRIGSAEIYAALEHSDLIEDSIVVSQRWDGDVRLILFVIPAQDVIERVGWTNVTKGIKEILRNRCSPRHVPEVILHVTEIPETYSGKPMELLVKRIVDGRTPNIGGCRNPECLQEYRDAVVNLRNAVPSKIRSKL